MHVKAPGKVTGWTKFTLFVTKPILFLVFRLKACIKFVVGDCGHRKQGMPQNKQAPVRLFPQYVDG